MKHRVGVMTALPEFELPQTLLAFGVAPGGNPFQHGGHRYWVVNLQREDGRHLEVVITSLTQSGNIEAALGATRMFEDYDCEFVAFVGIACGIRGKCNLGDVMWGEEINAYQFVKGTTNGKLERPRNATTPDDVVNDIALFQELQKGLWHRAFNIAQKKLSPSKRPRSPVRRPDLHRCVIASGDVVMADGRLLEMHQKNDRIRAGEMEGYGHAMGCQRRRPSIPWLVVRGISDFGDSSKDGEGQDARLQIYRHDEYHPIAALTAATFLRTFLETTYTLRPIPKTRLNETDFRIIKDETRISVKSVDGDLLLVTVDRRFTMKSLASGTYRFVRSLKGSQAEAKWQRSSLSYEGKNISLSKEDEGREIKAKDSLILQNDDVIIGSLLSKEKIHYGRGFYFLAFTSQKESSTLVVDWDAPQPDEGLDVFFYSEHLEATSLKIGQKTEIPKSDSGVGYVLRWKHKNKR